MHLKQSNAWDSQRGEGVEYHERFDYECGFHSKSLSSVISIHEQQKQ